LSLIESLPQELLAEILARVASSFVEDISHYLTVSRTISSALQDDHVIKRLNLRPQAMNPMLTFYLQSLSSLTMYQNMMNICVSAGNLEVHYLRGMQEYFQNENIAAGLALLQIAAQGSYDSSIYLY
ncbi:hypothetical protein BRARA_C04636, partial [Brassica rapa]